jgi:hypothetical protein
MDIKFSFIFKKPPWHILRKFAMYEFLADIYFDIVLSSTCRSPMYSIKRFSNPYFYTFEFLFLRCIVSVP